MRGLMCRGFIIVRTATVGEHGRVIHGGGRGGYVWVWIDDGLGEDWEQEDNINLDFLVMDWELWW